MKPAFWLCLLFIVISGLSAYIGNEWGRKLGKRKLSVFKLRPKYTSTFMTVLLSICLSLGGLGGFLLLFPELRQSLFMPELQTVQQLEAYQQQHAEMSKTLRQLALRQPEAESADQLTTQPLASATVQADHKPLLQQQPPARLARRPVVSRPDRDELLTDPLEPLDELEPLTDEPDPLQTHKRSQGPKPVKPSKAPVNNLTTSVASQPALRPSRLSKGQNSQNQKFPQAPTATPAISQQYAAAPLFRFQVTGELTAQESQQIFSGLLKLTENYAQLSGMPAQPFWAEPSQLYASQHQLQQKGAYELELHLAASETSALKVLLSVQPAQELESFDPNELLEEARLADSQRTRQLQQDLRLALRELAAERAVEGDAESVAPTSQPKGVQLASLPFELLNLNRDGSTLTATLLMPLKSGSGTGKLPGNLTEN